MRRIVYLSLGTLFTVLAIISACLPVLQAWFFWILAGVYFSKGSPRFHRWFINSWLYTKVISRFVDLDKKIDPSKAKQKTEKKLDKKEAIISR